jgi:Zn ribbon nucleic-acid-binding protein
MKSTKYLDHDALRAIRIDLTEGTVLEQIAGIRRSYKLQTGKRLKFRHAVEWLSLITAHFRETVADRPKTGFDLSCPACRRDERDLIVELNDVSLIQCVACGHEFTPESARDAAAETLTAWNRYLSSIAGVNRGTAVERLDERLAEEIEEHEMGCRCLATASA